MLLNNQDDKTENYPKYKINALKRTTNKDVFLNFGSNDKIGFESNESIRTDVEEISGESEKSEKKEKIQNSFNIFEIVLSQFFCCFLCGNLKIKNDSI